MSEIVIEVKGLSKQYRIGTKEERNDTFVGALKSTLLTPLRNYRKIRDLSRAGGDHENIFWALKDVSFEVKRGEVLGIIGRNGAGKSTLLKVLSRITEPTSGEINIRGRISSLLEVGTGFHPELTGRENVFMNGTILGMTRKEIARKFDEIVDFSGIEKFIDTPVKFYSSGMKVRLGFAVAAHLEPEILIIDEVLAVGDAEFQKKCLGKMKDVTGAGRTVLFVSHNMTAMNTLCDSILYLRGGQVEKIGETSNVINYYLSKGSDVTTRRKWHLDEAPGDDVAKLLEARLIDSQGNDIDSVDFYLGAGIEFTYEVLRSGFSPVPNLHLFNDKADYVLASLGSQSVSSEKGVYKAVSWLPPHLLNDGRYIVGIATSTLIPQKIHFHEREALIFDVIEDMNMRQSEFRGAMPGVVRPNLTWETQKIG